MNTARFLPKRRDPNAMIEQTLSPDRFQFRGDLSQTPLPEILVTIHHYRAPGVLECIREAETKRIFIDSGNIIFATSTNVFDSLGDRLLRDETITREQYEESVRRLKEDGMKRQGAILAEMGAIQPKDLFISVRSQVEGIVWSIFDWAEGSVFFEPGLERQQEFIKLNIPTRQAVLRGVRAMTDARALVARMGTKTTLLERNENADFADLTLLTEEIDLFEQINGKRGLGDLTRATPLPPGENAKILYAFFALRLVTIKKPRHLKVQVKTVERT